MERAAAHSRPAAVPYADRRAGLFVVDQTGKVVDWGDGATTIFGHARERAVGAWLADLIVPERLRDRHRERFASVLGDPDSPLLREPYETVVSRADGEEFDACVRLTRTATEPPNFVVAIEDLTHWPVPGQRPLETFVDSSEDAMATLDLQGVVLTWNPAAERLFGYAAAEVVGTRVGPLVVPEDRRVEREELFAAARAGEIVERETPRRHRDGTEMLLSVRLVPVREDGEVVSVVWIGRDVTDRRWREAAERDSASERLWCRRIEDALAGEGTCFAAQRVVDLETGAIDHYELLMRLRRGQELALPAQFLPVAERSGKIRDLDLWAVWRGLELATRFPVAINLSGVSLASDRLFEEISAAFAYRGVDPRRVTFEITETAAAADLARAVELFTRLTELGCGVALDDFGTGFGSFTYLNRLPITELKIDREFICDLGAAAIDERVVNTMVAIGRNFGMRTVAEGVEDEATLGRLRELGVDLAQGFHLGRPELIGDPALVEAEWRAASSA